MGALVAVPFPRALATRLASYTFHIAVVEFALVAHQLVEAGGSMAVKVGHRAPTRLVLFVARPPF